MYRITKCFGSLKESATFMRPLITLDGIDVLEGLAPPPPKQPRKGNPPTAPEKLQNWGLIETVSSQNYRQRNRRKSFWRQNIPRKSVEVLALSSPKSCNSTVLRGSLNISIVSEVDHQNASVYPSVLRSFCSGGASPGDNMLEFCGQTGPLSFAELMETVQVVSKIGEGSFAEVFLTGTGNILKVMPFGADREYNSCRQKEADEVLPEVIIAQYLHHLRDNPANRTDGFVEVVRSLVVRGRFPPEWVELWRAFAEEPGSLNDSPELFDDSQLFAVVELGNGGVCLEDFEFASNREQCQVMTQLALTLAVAEEAHEFEHRDLHVANVLISPSRPRVAVLNSKDLSGHLEGHTLKTTIIDYTLSRITCDGMALFTDLSKDPELFEGDGGIQFDVYRDMRTLNGDDWKKFQPRTNLLWLEYIGRIMLGEESPDDPHRTVLEDMVRAIPLYSSASHFVEHYLSLF